MRKTLLALMATLAIAGCSTAATVHPALTTRDHGNTEAIAPGPATSVHCGVDRWPVKTGTDLDASKVDLTTVVPATIADLGAIQAPTVLPQSNRASTTDASGRVVEETVYQVQATLEEYKMEGDSDYHLVLSDGQGHSMIAEIPAPPCVGPGSPFLNGITQARTAFDARYAPGDFFQPAGIPVTVTGVGFFDFLHGQSGVAPNGIELHPVLSIQFGS